MCPAGLTVEQGDVSQAAQGVRLAAAVPDLFAQVVGLPVGVMGLPRFAASVGHVPESGERVRLAAPVSGLPVQVIRVPVSLLSLAMITEHAVDIG
jgi:hypothetical protein